METYDGVKQQRVWRMEDWDGLMKILEFTLFSSQPYLFLFAFVLDGITNIF